MTKIVDYRNVLVTRNDLIVLKDVTFSLESGEFAYLIGKVGSGKSSLMKTMYAEVPIDEGEAIVLDYSVSDIKRKHIPFLRRQIGIVFQDFQLLTDRSAHDNLEFVLRATGWRRKTDIDKRIREVLAQVDMINKGYKKPHQLSGGEQQRVAIARALLNSPDLILADEPTGNLDPDTTDELMRLLLQINATGKTIIMATHNHNVISHFHARTIECENSLLLERNING